MAVGFMYSWSVPFFVLDREKSVFSPQTIVFGSVESLNYFLVQSRPWTMEFGPFQSCPIRHNWTVIN